MAPFQGPESASSYTEKMEHVASAAADQSGQSGSVPPSERVKVVVVGLGMVCPTCDHLASSTISMSLSIDRDVVA